MYCRLQNSRNHETTTDFARRPRSSGPTWIPSTTANASRRPRCCLLLAACDPSEFVPSVAARFFTPTAREFQEGTPDTKQRETHIAANHHLNILSAHIFYALSFLLGRSEQIRYCAQPSSLAIACDCCAIGTFVISNACRIALSTKIIRAEAPPRFSPPSHLSYLFVGLRCRLAACQLSPLLPPIAGISLAA